MLAQRLPSILPPLAEPEAWTATLVRSALAEPVVALERRAPFRAPHHGGSDAGLLGGGPALLPGEVTRAHGGVLFLDELPEWSRRALEGLRGPLEEGVVRLVRVHGRRSYPARFTLVAAMNPCPCGDADDEERGCRCHPSDRRRYQGRLSGPLLDRFDLQLRMPRPTVRELTSAAPGEASAAVAGRVARARARALQRQGCSNGALTGAALERWTPLAPVAELIERAWAREAHSARALERLRRVARTLADLDESDQPEVVHWGEALAYRIRPFG
jgi:magnesium chelatase family protein